MGDRMHAATRLSVGSAHMSYNKANMVSFSLSRLLFLKVETLDRRAFTARAAVLRQGVLVFYRGLAFSLLALVLLTTHFVVRGISRAVGPSLFEASCVCVCVCVFVPLYVFILCLHIW